MNGETREVLLSRALYFPNNACHTLRVARDTSIFLKILALFDGLGQDFSIKSDSAKDADRLDVTFCDE